LKRLIFGEISNNQLGLKLILKHFYFRWRF
jgi:hypothetical protein